MALFGKTATAKRGGSKTTDKVEIAIQGLRDLKACRRLRAVLLGLENRIVADAKTVMKTYFVTQGCETKVKPDNFTGVDEGQHGSCQLRARSFGPYGMNEDVADQIEAIGLGDLIVTREYYEIEAWVFNDPKVAAAIEAALSKVANAEEAVELKAKRTLKPGAIEWLFGNKGDDATFVENALELVATPAITIQFDKTDENIGPDADRVSHLLNNPSLADIIKGAAADPNKNLYPPTEKKTGKPKREKKAA